MKNLNKSKHTYALAFISLGSKKLQHISPGVAITTKKMEDRLSR